MGRSVQLDVVRAFAILLVIGAHLKIPIPRGVAGSVADVWHMWGGHGVPLFFTLSGYLVGGLLISELRLKGSIDIKRFLVRRGLKIYPAYFVLLAYLVIMPALKGDAALSQLVSDYWPNIFFMNNYIGPNLAGYTWSLDVEEHFYLTLPFLLLAFVRFGLTSWIAPLCLSAPLVGTVTRVICAASGDPYIHVFPAPLNATHLWIDGLMVGVGIRALAEFSPDLFARLYGWRWALIAAGLLIVASLALPMPFVLGVPLYHILPINTLSAAALLIGTVHLKLRGWGSSSLAWIGMYSYGIYLWHVTIIGFMGRIVVARLPWQGQISNWLIAASVTTAAAVLFGALMSRLVEWPVLAVRDRLFPSRSTVRPTP